MQLSRNLLEYKKTKGIFENIPSTLLSASLTFRMTKLLSLVLLAFLPVADSFCQDVSQKGNWSQKDRNNAFESLQASRSQFVNYLDSTSTETLISCLVDKMENTYANFDAVEQNSDEVQELTQNCLDFIMETSGKITPMGNPESKKGEWASADISSLVKELEKLRPELESTMPVDKIDQLLVCIALKTQDHYKNFAVALSDTSNTMPGFLYSCMEEQGVFNNQQDPFETEPKNNLAPDPNSSKGNWSENDKIALKQELNEMRPDLEARIGREKTDQVFGCILLNFEVSFENYADINNHPEMYKSILDQCYQELSN